MKLLADATLPELDSCFGQTFQLQKYHTVEELTSHLNNSDVLLCRATLAVNKKLLINSNIHCVATATSGIDHIETSYLEKRKIKWFAAQGSNAQAVADYAMACVAWLQANNLANGTKAGIIGLGHVGIKVARRLNAVGYDVIAFDPPKEMAGSQRNYCRLTDLYSCDLLMIHANLHSQPPFPSKHLVDASFLDNLKSNTVIINAARGGVVDEAALLAHSKPIVYCTDVYSNEPNIDPKIINLSTICTPHIAGHSIEAKLSAVYKLCEQLHKTFKLKCPINESRLIQDLPFNPKTTWHENILSLYNPFDETQALKSAQNIRKKFSSLRKAHTSRHNFSSYGTHNLDKSMQNILGIE